MGETILVFRRALAPSLPTFGFVSDTALLSKVLSIVEFMDRDLAETNEDYKQLVAYCLLRHNDSVIQYRRSKKASESRLHGYLSLGWGGHVSSVDNILPLWDDGMVGQAALREISEEISISSVAEPRLIGVVNEDTTAVGRVHLGVVYEFWLSEAKFTRKYGQGHQQAGFVNIADILSNIGQYELWSQLLALGYLSPR